MRDLFVNIIYGLCYPELQHFSNRHWMFNNAVVLRPVIWSNLQFFYNNIKILVNTSNYYINLQFMKYISACFDFRDELLTK